MKEYYLLIDGQQVGPYTAEQLHEMLAQGPLTAESPAWHDGLPDWVGLGTILEDVPATVPVRTATAQVGRTPAALTTVTMPASPSGVVQTNVRQGALLGGLVCFLLGMGLMYFSLFTFIFYGTLFFVALILSIVAMAQGRVASGVMLLLSTLVGPSVVGLFLFSTRLSDALKPSFTTLAEPPISENLSSPVRDVATTAPTTPPAVTTTTDTTSPAPSATTTNSSATTNESSVGMPPPLVEQPTASKHPALDAKMGFRTYKLGTPLSQFDPNDIEEGEAYIKTDMKPYSVKIFDKQLGAAEIDEIQLDFVQDILQSIIVHVKGEQSSLALKDVLIAAYGKADEDQKFMNETLTWEGEDCVLTYDTSGVTDADSSATFTSKSVDAKIKAITEQKAQTGAAAGAQDLLSSAPSPPAVTNSTDQSPQSPASSAPAYDPAQEQQDFVNLINKLDPDVQNWFRSYNVNDDTLVVTTTDKFNDGAYQNRLEFAQSLNKLWTKFHNAKSRSGVSSIKMIDGAGNTVGGTGDSGVWVLSQ